MQREITTHHMPALPARHKLEADDIWAMMLVVLNHKARKLFVKECHALTVAACTVQHNDAKARRLLHINPSINLGPLQESQVNVQLIHTAQRQIKATIAYVLNVVGTKTDNLHFLSYPPPLPRIPLVKNTYSNKCPTTGCILFV